MFQSEEINLPLIMLTSTLSIVVLIIGFFMFIKKYQIRRLLHLQEKQALQVKFQQELLQTQLEIQEQTLKNVSQEIHDNIGQTLSLAKLNLNTIDPHNAGQAQEKIGNTQELVSKAIKDLRTLSKTLHTDSILSTGLRRAIELELDLIDKAKVFQTELKVTGSPARLDPKKELILFRIVQEAMNNIIKHSKANTIDVQMAYGEKELVLSVADNGCGFNQTTNSNNPDTGSGLRNMQSRAELIGGCFAMASDTSGTRINITVPINAI
jgi:signal transduction histidine kinase